MFSKCHRGYRHTSEDSWDRLQTPAVDDGCMDGWMDHLRQLAVLMVSNNRLLLLFKSDNCVTVIVIIVNP